MKKRYFFTSLMIALAVFLSGCNISADELLGVVQEVINDLTDGNEEQAEEEVEETIDTETDESESESGDVDVVAQSASDSRSYDDYIASFLERLTKQGYDFHGVSNGFPVDTPYHWVLVDVINDDDRSEYFEGMFCFDLPYEKNELKDVFVNMNQFDYDQLGAGDGYFDRTNFSIDNDFANVTGSVNYFEDSYNNTCAHMYFDFSGDGNFTPIYGEDPATMVGDQDVDYQGSQNADNQGYRFFTMDFLPSEQPNRQLPQNYDQLLTQLDTSGYSEGDQTESIIENILSNRFSMEHFSSGYPKIFPYEWYAVSLNDSSASSSFEGKFCTDLITEQSIYLHLVMLGNYSSNIHDLQLNDKTNKDNLARVDFSFNDEYGTGSWSGNSTFYIDESGPHAIHRCVDVSMDFSSELVQ